MAGDSLIVRDCEAYISGLWTAEAGNQAKSYRPALSRPTRKTWRRSPAFGTRRPLRPAARLDAGGMLPIGPKRDCLSRRIGVGRKASTRGRHVRKRTRRARGCGTSAEVGPTNTGGPRAHRGAVARDLPQGRGPKFTPVALLLAGGGVRARTLSRAERGRMMNPLMLRVTSGGRAARGRLRHAPATDAVPVDGRPRPRSVQGRPVRDA